MSNVESDIHSALMAEVQRISEYTLIWPQKGGDKPEDEYVAVYHIPNENGRRFLSSTAPQERKGFLDLILVSPLGTYEVVTKRKAGEISLLFPIDLEMTANATTIKVQTCSVGPGREVNGRWETSIRVGYWGFA